MEPELLLAILEEQRQQIGLAKQDLRVMQVMLE
jgi:hypothetical protein